MLDNLPVGSYIPHDSVIHGLRARTKLLLLCWLAFSFFVANHKRFHYGVYGWAFALLLLTLSLSGANPGYIWRRMRVLFILMALSVPFILIWTAGATWRAFDLFTLTVGRLTLPFHFLVTYEGLWFSVTTTSIFLLRYLGTLALTLSTRPVALDEAIVLLLRPFRRMGLPADEFGLMTLLSLRFVPTLVQETNQLIKAQVSRGADFTTGSLWARARGVITLVVPLTEGALRRAGGLATALEARGYGVTGEATMLHEGRLRWLDWTLLLVIPAATILVYLYL
jgi:energy-coupling factor transport system permease protein